MNDRLATALSSRYRIERRLGEGGMATVYLAEDLRHQRRVAIKVLKPELAAVLGGDRFIQEITTTAQLQHPHILPLFDSGAADGFLFYVMPYVEGETLRDRLDREKQLGVEEAVRIAREVADALDYAHRRGVIHRDIKPENILLHDGRPVVADFGIALAVSAAAGGRMTETGMSLGTPYYMSPEQATAEKDLTGRSDVYSLASVLYEMLTGDPPHTGSSAQQIIVRIITDPVRPVGELRRSVPANVAAAVGKALEKLAADRFETARAFADALADPHFTVVGSAEKAASDARSAGGPMAVGRILPWGVTAVAVVVALFSLLRQEDAPRPVVRFPFVLPPGQSVALRSEDDIPFALSPDGTRIVYSARDSGASAPRLYVRALDQVDAVPLQGTEGGVSPFFSPDGLWVGFFADRILKKVPVEGGPATSLVSDLGVVNTASWGDDGYIVYTATGGPLARVRGSGGVSERLVEADGAAPASGMPYPSVLPGSEGVLFTACTTSCGNHDLAILDVETRTVRVVVPGATRGWYVGTGHLIYSTEGGAVYAVPFDLSRRAVTGDPVPVLDQVASGWGWAGRLAVSPSGALIYISSPTEGAVQVLEVDRSGRETVRIRRPGQYAQPRWSPNEDRIAVTMGVDARVAPGMRGGRQWETQEIWVYDVTSETLAPLSSGHSTMRSSWSPDGARLVFYQMDGDTARLYWAPADRSAPAEPVTPSPVTIGASTTFWTRDGAWIVVDGATAPGKDEDILAVGTGPDRTVVPVVTTPEDDQNGAVSPDGEWIAYNAEVGGRYQVFVRPFRREGGQWLVSTGPANSPLWASNGELVYADLESNSLVAATLELGASVRVTKRNRLFGLERYAPFATFFTNYDVSRDGQRFLMVQGQQRSEWSAIVVLNWFEEVERRMAEQGGK